MDIHLKTVIVYHIYHSVPINVCKLKKWAFRNFFSSHQTKRIHSWKSCIIDWLVISQINKCGFLSSEVDLIIVNTCSFVLNCYEQITETIAIQINHTTGMRHRELNARNSFLYATLSLIFNKHRTSEVSYLHNTRVRSLKCDPKHILSRISVKNIFKEIAVKICD